jgi:pimeloyl-ACP methyl ester carboxylesterase
MPAYTGSDGAELEYDVIGPATSPPLIVLAGGAGAHPAYLGDLAGLSERHQLVLVHLRGVGRSAGADLATMGSRWRQAEDIDRLRAHLGLGECAIVAHSAGTRLAIAYAAAYPVRVRALVLITPPAAYLVDTPSDVPALAARRMDEPVVVAALSAFHAGPDTSNDETFNAWQQAAAPLGYARWDGPTQAHARAMWYSMAAARAFLGGDEPADLLARLGAVPAPTLVVAGAEDTSAGFAPVVAVAELFPRGRSAVIDRCGHFPWIERPIRFREALDPFLAEFGL